MRDDPFQPLLDQIADLLKFAEKNSGKAIDGPTTPELEAQLQQLEFLMKEFKAASDEVTKEITPVPMEQRTPEDQRLARQCLDLGLNTVVLGGSLRLAKKNSGKSKQRDVSKNTKKSIQKRKNKFKGIGGKDTWQRT